MIEPVRRLELVHFQLTRRCNLHCWFCGQQAENSTFAGRTGGELSLEEWQGVIEDLEEVRQKTGASPSVILWGGEPLVSPHFAPVAEELARRGFPLGMVTNGTLLDRYSSLCREVFRQIYVSLDGTPAVHDAVRGAGVYEKVAENLALVRGGKARITIMSVMTDEAPAQLERMLDGFALLEPDEVLLQEMIALSPGEAQAYRSWLLDSFDLPAPGIAAWVGGEPARRMPHQWYEEWIARHPYPFPVRHLPHGAQALRPFCLSPCRHLHVAWDGEVGFCTDFTDFTLGNERDASLQQLFTSERAERFARQVRQGQCAACEHCSWKNSETFGL